MSNQDNEIPVYDQVGEHIGDVTSKEACQMVAKRNSKFTLEQDNEGWSYLQAQPVRY